MAKERQRGWRDRNALDDQDDGTATDGQPDDDVGNGLDRAAQQRPGAGP
jgi:hypothetical protein